MNPQPQAQPVLEIITLYRGTVLDVQHLAPGDRFTIGPDAADLPIEHPALAADAEPYRLAALDAEGRARIDLLPGFSATVLADGTVQAVERPGGLRLVPGHKARVDLGDISLLFALVQPVEEVPRAPISLLDRGGRRFFGIAAALHAALLAVAFTVPVQAGSISLDRFGQDPRWVEVVLRPTVDEPLDWTKGLEQATAASDGEPVEDSKTTWPRPQPDAGGADGAKAPGDDASKAAGKKIARDTADAVAEAMDSVMPPDMGLGASAHAALNGLNGGDRGQAGALGGWGDTLSQVGGPGVRNGLNGGPSVGVRISTRGGRDYSPGPSGPRIPKRPGKAPKVIPQDPVVVGGLTKDQIQRVVRRNRNAVRYCYEKALQTRPDLEGKVRVKFVVGADGRVLTAAAIESTMGIGEVDACIARQVNQWQFPAVRGGGAVVVTYPFLFRAGR